MHGKAKKIEKVQCVVVRVQGEVFVSHHSKNAAAMREKNLKSIFYTSMTFCETSSKNFLY
jgi:hypothetical protein